MRYRSGKKSRIIVILLLSSLVFLFSGMALATGDATVSGANISAAAGSAVEYAIRIDNNPGIAAFKIFVECDKSLFSIGYDASNGSLDITQGDFSANGSLLSNTYLSTGWQILWFNTSDQAADGDLATIRFIVAENASVGVYPITIRYSAKDTINQNEVRVPLATVNGSITVTEAEIIPVPVIIGTEKTAKVGQYVDYGVYVDNNPGIAAFKVFVECDTDVFSATVLEGAGYVVERGSFSSSGTILCNTYVNKGWQISWFDTKNADANGPLFTLPLFVSENALPGVYPVIIRCSYADIVNRDGVIVDFASINGSVQVTAPPTGFTVSGLVKSYNPQHPTTLQLQGENITYPATIDTEETGSGQREQDFAFEGVEPGTYTLIVSKDAHADFIVHNIVVDDQDVDLTEDARPEVQLMTMRCGDINGDGNINNSDLTILWRQANYNRSASAADEPLCDLNGDGLINNIDLTILWLAYNYNRGAVEVN